MKKNIIEFAGRVAIGIIGLETVISAGLIGIGRLVFQIVVAAWAILPMIPLVEQVLKQAKK